MYSIRTGFVYILHTSVSEFLLIIRNMTQLKSTRISWYWDWPEQQEDACSLWPAKDRLVFTQQVRLVPTRWSESFFVQQRHQHLHRVSPSVCGGVIDRICFWLNVMNKQSSVRAACEGRWNVCEGGSFVWLESGGRPLPWQGLSPSRFRQRAVSGSDVAGKSFPSAPSRSPLWQRTPVPHCRVL